MMFICFLISAACFFSLVIPHPLLQNIQPFPVTNYQHAYLPPYNEAFVVQQSNNHQCSQPVPIEASIFPYQTLQTPSITKQVTNQPIQIYWDKLLSDPSMRNILDSNKNEWDPYGRNGQINSHPYTGRIVNNYIIVPPDFVKLNETVERPKTTMVRTESKRPVKQNVATNKKKKKQTNNNDNTSDVKSSNTKTPRKVKQNSEETWSFNTENIKCFKPVDVLKHEKYQPEKKVKKNKEAIKQRNKENTKKKTNSTPNCENKNKPPKAKKTKPNKVKNKSQEHNTNECRKKKQNKTKQSKITSKMCECQKRDHLSTKSKTVDVPRTCDQNIEELLLSALLQQDCNSLENRCTRNSKNDKAKTNGYGMYPNLPGDISSNFNWYLNDLYSPQSLQQAFSSNAFQGNKYPFDFSQIYQIPQYSNPDANKSKGNTENNKNTRRKKKKKKKNSKTNTGKDSTSNIGDTNSRNSGTKKNDKIPETSTQIPTINNEPLKIISTQTLETTIQTSESMTTEMNPHTSEKSNQADLETTEQANSMNNETKPTDLVPDIFEKLTTESVHITSTTPVDTQASEESLDDDILKTIDDNLETEEESKELYETQIPESVVVITSNENNTEVLESEEKVADEMLPILGFDIFNQHPGFGSQEEIFNMLINDYYPDFRADNHAYLVSDEEIDVRNIHDRYFYETDKNIDSKENYLPENVNQLSDNEVISDEDKLRNIIFEHSNNKNIVNEKDKLPDIAFRTPPGLEVPDFITRKVNRDNVDSAEIYYHHNNVDDCDRFNLDNFADNSDDCIKTAKINDNPGQIVETVYAKSKVVKYGQGQESTKPKLEPKTAYPDDGIIQNDRTAVVIAKSLRPGDFW